MCAQSVHERIVKLGISNKRNIFTESENEIIKDKYADYADRGDLASLANIIGREKCTLCGQARKLGLTDKKRKKPYLAEGSSKKQIAWLKDNDHPKGALGMKHSEESKKKMSEKLKDHWKNMSNEMRDEYSKRASISARKISPLSRANDTSWKAGWRDIGAIRKYYRSRWEANYARYLQWLQDSGNITSWKHECKTFWFEGIKRGCMSYLPDFEVIENDGRVEYHEVKGWMDDRSITKIKRMAKYHPDIKLIVIDAKGYRALQKKISGLIIGWEFDKSP